MGLPPPEDLVGDSGKNGGDPGGAWESEDDGLAEAHGHCSMAAFGNDTVFARIAYSHGFQNTTLAVIVLNAIWIGVDVQANNPKIKEDKGSDKLPLEPVSTVIENMFATYFSVELLTRFLGFRRKSDCVRDGWFVFDGLLVLFMVIETWILAIVSAIVGGSGGGALSKFSALRLLRLLRLTRMARLMHEVPELLTLVKGILAAARAVTFILLFLLLCMYVFAIIFTAQLGDPDAPEHKYADPYWVSDSDPTAVELFGSMGDSMMTLFTRGVLGDNLAETLQAIKDRGGSITCDPMVNGTQPICEREGGSLFLFWVFVVFMVISAFCLLNMLIGVLCEVVQDSAAKESETQQLTELRQQMAEAFQLIDTSHDGMITEEEWVKMKSQQKVRCSMAGLGVEDQHMEARLNQIQESLFGMNLKDDLLREGIDAVVPMGENQQPARQGLTFAQFLRKVVEIRPDTPASALDIEILNSRVQAEEKVFMDRLEAIEETLKKGASASPPPPASTPPRIGVPPERPASEASSWLRNIPTDALFAVLRSRAPPEPSQPKMIIETLR